MMIERHYDDEALIALMESDRLRTDAHLPSCSPCSEKLESFQMIADALRERDTWDTRETRSEPVLSTIANLRAFADRMTSEDAQAEIILESLLAGPREEWMPRLREHPGWRTAGVVRKLVERTFRVLGSAPPDALEIGALATEIADHLDDKFYSFDLISRLCGNAWRERGYALYYTGDLARAEVAIERARQALGNCRLAEYEFSRVGILEALVHRNMDRSHLALESAQQSAATFEAYGDHQRYVGARSAEASVLVSAGRHEEALQIWLSLEKSFAPDDGSDARLRILSNIAYAYRQLGATDQAATYFRLVAGAYDLAGTKGEAARVRWNMASMLFEGGRIAEAAERFEAVRAEFSLLGMYGAAAMVAVDLAEVRIVQQRVADVIGLCTAALEQFQKSGAAYTDRALTAVAFMREAAESGRATTQLVQHVREYVRRLPQEPALLFVPPPQHAG